MNLKFDHDQRRHGALSTLARWIALALIALVALGAPAAAVAQTGNSPTKAQYGPTNQQISAGGDKGDDTIGGLPFTGLDVGIMAASAVLLLGAGVALRRLSDPERGSS
jgi:hypothetical protein